MLSPWWARKGTKTLRVRTSSGSPHPSPRHQVVALTTRLVDGLKTEGYIGLMSHAELVAQNRQFTLTSWTAQASWNPFSMERAEGVYFWDADEKLYLDWSSQLVNVNVGHGHPHVVEAIREQATRITYAYPGIATGPRGQRHRRRRCCRDGL